MTQSPLEGKVYEAIPEFEDHLEKELGPGCEVWKADEALPSPALFLVPSAHASSENDSSVAKFQSFWNRNIWLNPQKIEFDSIGEAARALRGIQRNWAPSLFTQFRRGALIAEKLPPIPNKPRVFPWLIPDTPMGAWTLLDAHTLVASPDCSSPFPGGVIEFEEDKFNPPSRAYLKCWESLVRLGRWPGKGERCFDAGASPGGWTWALANLGAEVIAVDRAPLEPRVEAMPGVSFIKHDAFTLKPEDTGKIDWLFCDVICYPPRLFEWIEKWLASGLCRNFVCTIKMQGNDPDLETTRRFAAIPGSTVVHLHHNKHELTWMKINDPTHPTVFQSDTQ